jgi:hypothetical protein
VHLQPFFTPLMTSLTLSVVCGICARSHHQVSDDADTFTISPVAGYMMICVGVVCCVGPFLPGVAGDMSTMRFFWYSSPFWLLAFVGAAFFFRYCVVVRDQTLTYGAFRRRVIPFSQVIDFDVLHGQKSGELWLYLKTGKRLKFSGLLSDFDELVGMVNSHMAGLPGPQHDSVAKIRDQEKRRTDSRTANWVMFIGLGIVALVVFVLWRMRLLH